MIKKQQSKWFELKFKICLLNSYFDKGMSLTKYIKYALFIAGLSSAGRVFWQMCLLGGIYLTSCFFMGWLWYKYKWIEAEYEVGNRFNMLARELRNSMKKENFK